MALMICDDINSCVLKKELMSLSLFSRKKKVKMAFENLRFEHMAAGGCCVTVNHLFQEGSHQISLKR